MLNAMLVSLSEHAFSPSAASCRFVRSGGVPLNTAVAGGILTLGTQHASADIPAAMFQEGVKRAEIEETGIEEMAYTIVTDYRREKKIINGYHHPQHIIDPRVSRLLELAASYEIRGKHQQLARAIENATEKVIGKKLYMNGPGAIAAISSDMGLSPEQIKGLLILSRTVSLIAHSIEEGEREKGWRASTQTGITQPLDLSLQLPEYYDGPEDRSLDI
jgi:citrate synthase